MNNTLLDIVKEIMTNYGKNVISEPKRLSAFLSDLAKDVPKSRKNAFIKCIEYGCVQSINNIQNFYTSHNDSVRLTKDLQNLSHSFHNDEGYDIKLCEETIDLLYVLLFGKKKEIEKKIICKNCNKEMLKEWNTCPYCSVSLSPIQPVKKQSIAKQPVIKKTAPVEVKKPKEIIEVDVVKRTFEIWICGRCDKTNNFEDDKCKKCGKEFNPPLTAANQTELKKIKLYKLL